MIELRALIDDGGPLSEFFLQPPKYLSPQNGVTGIALRYNPLFVSEVSRSVTYEPGAHEGSVEHSTAVAVVLAAAARRMRDGKGDMRAVSALYWRGVELVERWQTLTERRFDGRPMSPIEIEVTVGRDFPRMTERTHPEPIDRYQQFPIVFRLAPPARLHFASSGGRFAARYGSDVSQPWGTLGGFLTSPASRPIYAMTAAHVVPSGCSEVLATLSFEATANLGMNRILQRAALTNLLPKAWRPTTGHIVHRSPPDMAVANQCSARSNPNSAGLDVALAEWPIDDGGRRLTRAVAFGEISQALTGRFVGARSGAVNVRVACYSIWQSYQLDEAGLQTACIGDCLQVALAHRPYVWTDVSKRGDSGAWVMSDGHDGAQWLGLLVGGDGERSGVVPAHRILDHLAPTFGALIPRI